MDFCFIIRFLSSVFILVLGTLRRFEECPSVFRIRADLNDAQIAGSCVPNANELAFSLSKESKEIITVSQAVLGKSQEKPLFLKKESKTRYILVWAQLAVPHCAQGFFVFRTAIWELLCRRLPLWRLPQSGFTDSVWWDGKLRIVQCVDRLQARCLCSGITAEHNTDNRTERDSSTAYAPVHSRRSACYQIVNLNSRK